MKEINVTFTKKQNLLSDRNKGKRITQEGNFVSGTFPNCAKGVKQRNVATSRVLHSFTVAGKSPPCQNTPLSLVSRI